MLLIWVFNQKPKKRQMVSFSCFPRNWTWAAIKALNFLTLPSSGVLNLPAENPPPPSNCIHQQITWSFPPPASALSGAQFHQTRRPKLSPLISESCTSTRLHSVRSSFVNYYLQFEPPPCTGDLRFILRNKPTLFGWHLSTEYGKLHAKSTQW